MKKSDVIFPLICASLPLFLLICGVSAVRVDGNSMLPALSDGDVLLCLKRMGISRGDIAVFSLKDSNIVKRVADISGDGFRVLGDNREYSIDSRIFGRLPLYAFKGRVILRIYPLSKAGRIG